MTGGSGLKVVSADGRYYGAVTIASNNSTARVLSSDVETGSVAVRAPETNDEPVYIGFDDDADSNSGFPLYAGDVVSLDINSSYQGLWVYAEFSGQEIRVMALS